MALTLSDRNGAGADATMLMRIMVMFMVGLPCMCRAIGIVVPVNIPIGILVENEKQQQYFLDASTPLFSAWVRGSQITISGRTCYLRHFEGKHIVLVKHDKGLINAAITTEVLLTSFPSVKWVIHYGKVASPGTDRNIGDLVLRSETAQTGNWFWANQGDSSNHGLYSLNFVDFTTQEKNSSACRILSNSLNQAWYRTSQVPSPDGSNDFVFWLTTPGSAFPLPNVQLAQCAEMGQSHVCLDKQPKVVTGLRGCSADIYVDNAAYAKFLTKTVGCDTLDMNAAAVAQVCKSRKGVSLLLTATVSNRAGVETNEKIPCTQIIDRVSYPNAVTTIRQIVKAIPTVSPRVGDPQSQVEAQAQAQAQVA